MHMHTGTFVFSIHAPDMNSVGFISSDCFPEGRPVSLLAFFQNSDLKEHLK